MNNTIKTRLQVFLAKIAGKDVDVSTLTPPVAASLEEKLMLDIADRIDDIEGGTLPNVSSTDNGDVLTVVEGAWAKAAPSGGGVYPVSVTISYDEGEKRYTADKTFNEIKSAILGGKNVIFTYTETIDYGVEGEGTIESSAAVVAILDNAEEYSVTLGNQEQYTALDGNTPVVYTAFIGL